MPTVGIVSGELRHSSILSYVLFPLLPSLPLVHHHWGEKLHYPFGSFLDGRHATR